MTDASFARLTLEKSDAASTTNDRMHSSIVVRQGAVVDKNRIIEKLGGTTTLKTRKKMSRPEEPALVTTHWAPIEQQLGAGRPVRWQKRLARDALDANMRLRAEPGFGERLYERTQLSSRS